MSGESYSCVREHPFLPAGSSWVVAGSFEVYAFPM